MDGESDGGTDNKDTSSENGSGVVRLARFRFDVSAIVGSEVVKKATQTDGAIVCSFAGCTKTFATAISAQTHVVMHNKERPFFCEWVTRLFLHLS